MGFKMGIVGLPNVGKSTLFNALTRTAAAQAANFPFCTIEPNVGEVAVPDARLDKLAAIGKSASRCIPARMSFVDIAGLVKGRHQGRRPGQPVPRQHPRMRRHRLCAALLRGRQHHPRRQQGRSARRRRSGRDRADAGRSRKPRKALAGVEKKVRGQRQGSQAHPRPDRPRPGAARGRQVGAPRPARAPTKRRRSASCSSSPPSRRSMSAMSTRRRGHRQRAHQKGRGLRQGSTTPRIIVISAEIEASWPASTLPSRPSTSTRSASTSPASTA